MVTATEKMAAERGEMMKVEKVAAEKAATERAAAVKEAVQAAERAAAEKAAAEAEARIADLEMKRKKQEDERRRSEDDVRRRLDAGDWEISCASIKWGKSLGEGSFGQVLGNAWQ